MSTLVLTYIAKSVVISYNKILCCALCAAIPPPREYLEIEESHDPEQLWHPPGHHQPEPVGAGAVVHRHQRYPSAGAVAGGRRGVRQLRVAASALGVERWLMPHPCRIGHRSPLAITNSSFHPPPWRITRRGIFFFMKLVV